MARNLLPASAASPSPYTSVCAAPHCIHTHTHTLRSCCKANLFKLKVNTLSHTRTHLHTLNVILEALHGPRWATPIYFGNTIKYTIALVINRNASLAFFSSPLLHSPPAPSLRSPRSVLARLLFVYALPYSPDSLQPLWKIMLQPLCPTY